MTDEQYIESLIEKGFDQREINQLLKIYVYTKKFDFILNVDTDIDIDLLRIISNNFKENKFTEDYLNSLRIGQDHECDIIPFLLEVYNKFVMASIMELEIDGFDITNLKNSKYDYEQMALLRNYIRRGINGVNEYCANPNYSVEKMKKITIGLTQDVIIQNYIDVDLFSEKQCAAITDIIVDFGDDENVDLEKIKNPNLSINQMYHIAELMHLNLPYEKLLKEGYPENYYKIIYDAIKNNEDITMLEKYLADKSQLKEKQINTIVEILKDKDFNPDKYDYNKIFNEKNNYFKMNIYHNLVKNNEIEFLDKIIDKDYTIEQITDLHYFYKLKIDIDTLKDKSIEKLHLYKRNHQLKEIGKTVDSYKVPQKRVILENPPTKFPVLERYGCDHYFATSNNHIIKITEDNESFKDIIGEIHSGEILPIEILEKYEDTIKQIFKNRFMLRINEETEDLNLYDITTKKDIDTKLDKHNITALFIKYFFDEETFYSDMFDSVLVDFEHYDEVKNESTPFNSPFSYAEDFMENIPNLRDDFKIFRYGDMSETWYYVVTSEHIIDKYGKIDEETLMMVEEEYAKNCQYLDATSNCEVYMCEEYDMNLNLINKQTCYYGTDIIEQVERDFNITVTRDLHLNHNINEVIDEYRNSLSEER